MRARLATAEQFYDYPDFESLTPRGWSNESEKIHNAEVVSINDFFGTPASRLHLHGGDDYRSVLRIAAKDLGNILAVIRHHLPKNTREQIGRRIGVLLDSSEWDVDDEFPSPESFRIMLSFFATHRGLRRPSIFLNRYGLFTASWRPEKRKLASFVFHPDENVNWLVFSPQKNDEEDVIETAGRAPIDVVLKEVSKHGALKWMQRPNFIARLLGNA